MISDPIVFQEQTKAADLEILKIGFIEENKCIGCLGPADFFKDDVSFIDYVYISGLCQKCQDGG